MFTGPLYKKAFSIISVASIVFSVIAILVIWHDESVYYQNQSLTSNLSFKGAYVVDNDNVSRPITNGYKFKLSGFRTLVAEGHFTSDIPKNKRVIMRIDNMRVKVYSNGVLLYNFGTRGSIPSYAKSAGNSWGTFISPGILTTDNITIELENIYAHRVNKSFNSFFDNMYHGYERDLIIRNISYSSVNSFVAIFIISIGFIALYFSILLYRMKKPIRQLISFTFLFIFSGIWFFLDFTVQNYFFAYPIVNNSLNVLSFMLALAFTMVYYAVNIKNNWRILLYICAFVWFLLTIISTVLQLVGYVDYFEFAYIIMLMGCISFIALAVSLIAEKYYVGYSGMPSLFIAFIFLIIGAFLDILLNYMGVVESSLWLKIGFFGFLVFSFVNIAKIVKQFVIDIARLKAVEEESQNLARVLGYQTLMSEATKGLYENIFEFDLTHNKIIGDDTRRYFKNIGLPVDTPYDKAIYHVAETQIHEDFRQGYIDTFSPENVLAEYRKGSNSVSYDFMLSLDGKDYYWIRVTARMFYWATDKTVRMITFRQNINEEKQRENILSEKAKRDPLTGLYNKAATEETIKNTLACHVAGTNMYAFFIIDIDNFKYVNDNYGHAVGDTVIKEFTKEFKTRFRGTDIIGRIGGDEFVIFLSIPSLEWLKNKAGMLSKGLNKTFATDEGEKTISASIGIAIYPEGGTTFETLYINADKALYQTKKNGKNNYSIYSRLG